MYDKGQLDLSPAFQREQVWDNATQTRFLDSLIKNLPIPSMCFGQDIETGKRIVIDGLQRISTIVRFLQNAEKAELKNKLSNLEDIDKRLSGKTAYQIFTESPEVFEAIENVSIPVTVLRSNFSSTLHMEYIFTIFHRLNTGGIRLNAQEIRNCIFNGNFNNLLIQCAEKFSNELDILTGTKENKRFTHEEFVLRFFAFNNAMENYRSPLTRFLNIYMKENRDLSEAKLLEKEEQFHATMNLFQINLVDIKIRNKTIAEALLYGIAQNINTLHNKPKDFFEKSFENMLANTAFNEKELKDGIFANNKVKLRLETAKTIFSDS